MPGSAVPPQATQVRAAARQREDVEARQWWRPRLTPFVAALFAGEALVWWLAPRLGLPSRGGAAGWWPGIGAGLAVYAVLEAALRRTAPGVYRPYGSGRVAA